MVCRVWKTEDSIRKTARYPSSLAHVGRSHHLFSVRGPVVLATLNHPNLAVTYVVSELDPRRSGSILTSDQIKFLISSSEKIRGGSGISWRLVEKDSDGTITDFDYYRKNFRG